MLGLGSEMDASRIDPENSLVDEATAELGDGDVAVDDALLRGRSSSNSGQNNFLVSTQYVPSSHQPFCASTEESDKQTQPAHLPCPGQIIHLAPGSATSSTAPTLHKLHHS